MRFYKLVILSFCLFVFLQACIEVPKQHGGPAPGIWRGIFILEDTRQIIVTKGKDKIVTRDVNPESMKKLIPFQFEFIKPTDSTYAFVLVNGLERITFNEVHLGYNIRNGTDTFEINLEPYDAVLKGVWEHNKLAGDFIVRDKKSYSIPFTAQYGQNFLFKKIPEKAEVNLTGNWEVIFDQDSADAYRAIGEFEQSGSNISGTFRTETGDYRYLTGQVMGHQVFLSTFDGAHVFMFELNVMDDQFKGIFYSGNHYQAALKGKRNSEMQLTNPEELTKIISKDPVKFSFKNTEGKFIDLNDEKYRGKSKIIQILGTWCPNCRDECEFLKAKLDNGEINQTEIIGLAFERIKDPELGIQRIKRYKDKMGLPYELLLAGPASKDSASAIFPQLDEISAFPTMIFLDKNNVIQKVHTGFDGPATSAYKAFQTDFIKTIESLK
ncbi:MAG: TlpA family protein disulfide reductase [Saprospiraceae bacterium]|nr:TlpA family protein disulfide reductase [Saprospiraceae bacterium]